MIRQTHETMELELKNILRMFIQHFGVSDTLVILVNVLDEIGEDWATKQDKIDQAKALSVISNNIDRDRLELL